MKHLKYTPIYALVVFVCLIIIIAVHLRHQNNQIETTTADLPQIREKGILRVALGFNKSSFFVSSDTLAGLEYELSQELGKDWEIDVELHPVNNLTESLSGLQNGQFDIVAQPIPITEPGKEEFNFTIPLFTQKMVLVQRNAASNKGILPIRNLIDLGKKDVSISSNKATRLRLKHLSEEIADTIYTHVDSLYGDEQLIILVAKGDLDYAICDEPTARIMKTHFPNLDILTAISFNQFRGWAVRKENPILLDSLNFWLKKHLSSKHFQTQKKKYLQEFKYK